MNRTIPVRLLPGAPKLFVDYISDFGRVSDLFEHDFRDPGAFVRAADTAAARELPRDAVADVLLAQSRLFRSGQPTVRNIERLRDPNSVAVVTGQQPALFGGPLYNLYKALTAVRLSQALEERTGRPHVPVFWIANDDHGLTERRSRRRAEARAASSSGSRGGTRCGGSCSRSPS